MPCLAAEHNFVEPLWKSTLSSYSDASGVGTSLPPPDVTVELQMGNWGREWLPLLSIVSTSTSPADTEMTTTTAVVAAATVISTAPSSAIMPRKSGNVSEGRQRGPTLIVTSTTGNSATLTSRTSTQSVPSHRSQSSVRRHQSMASLLPKRRA